MSDRHHGGGGQPRYFKTGDGYGGGGGSSKRYHSPITGSSGGGGGSGGYYEPKRSRTDNYAGGGGGGSSGALGGGYHHTSSSSSSRYNEYSHSHGGGSGSSYSASSSRYKLPSSSSSTIPFYDSGLKSKYIDDYKSRSRGSLGVGGSSGGSGMKSSVRRIPPPSSSSLSSMSMSSKMMMSNKSSSSYGSVSRPLPLMKVSIPSSGGHHSGGGSRDYEGSRLRTAPPEHHSSASYSYSSSSTTFRKPELKRVGVLRNPHGPIYAKSSVSSGGGSSSFKRGTLRAAASVTSKIRRRAPLASTYDDRKKRIESYSSSRRELDRTHRTERRKAVEPSSRDKDKKKDSEVTKKRVEKKVEEVKLPDGEVGVVLDEVGGDSDSDDNINVEGNKDEEGSSPVKASKKGGDKDADVGDDDAVGGDAEIGPGSKDDQDDHCCKSQDKHRDSHDREGSPSNRALLKLYCKYCDVRHVTFREYSHHLRSFPHIRAMNTSVTDMRKQLSKIRTQQRDEQRRAEKEEKVELSDTTSYCRVCELNFRTDPKEHEANELHNEIKTLIYQRCEICDIDFRIWKVYLYHMAALEHVKRIAMKELKEAETKADGVKGTNLTQEELGGDLVEVRTVFFCNACVRYLPIKGEVEEAKERHCMTLAHIKGVEEFRQREKKIAERQRIRLEREEREKERKKLKEESKTKESSSTDATADAVGGDSSKTEENIDGSEASTKQEIEEVAGDVATVKDDDTKMETSDGKDTTEPVDGEEQEGVEIEDQDLDEIELHAEGDEEEDENDQDQDKSWNRRTRSAKLAN